MTLKPSLTPYGHRILTVADFNSYQGVDQEAVCVLVTGAWSSGDAMWYFRYRLTNPDGTSNGNNNKWDFIGGAPVIDRIDELVSATFSSTPNWLDFRASHSTPTFSPVPFTGVYTVRFGSGISIDASGTSGAGTAKGTGATVGIAVNGADPTADIRALKVAGADETVSKHDHLGLTLGDDLHLEYFGTSNTVAFYRRWMEVVPVRVSSG